MTEAVMYAVVRVDGAGYDYWVIGVAHTRTEAENHIRREYGAEPEEQPKNGWTVDEIPVVGE